MNTIHDAKVSKLMGDVSTAKLKADNASWKMGARKQADYEEAKEYLDTYMSDESQHDHSEIPQDDLFEEAEIVETEPLIMSKATDLVVASTSALVADYPTMENINIAIEATRVKAKADAAKFDVKTAKGRASIIKVATGVRDAKVKMEKAAIQVKKPLQDKIKKVNDASKALTEGLAVVQAEIRQPVTDQEELEKRRVAALNARLFEINIGGLTLDSPSLDIMARISNIRAVELGDDWQEYLVDAGVTKDRVLNELTTMLTSAEFREDQAERLAELEAAEAERQMIADKEAEASRLEQERNDEEDGMWRDAEAENARFDQAKIDQAAAVQKAKDDAEAERVTELENAEQKRLDDIEAAEQAVRDEAQKTADDLAQVLADALAKSENDKAAAQAETDRLKLEQDKAHNARQFRAKARDQIHAVLDSLTSAEFVDAVMNDEIPLLRFMPEGVK